jgi:hypothetical protein
MILDGYFDKLAPLPFAHQGAVERFEPESEAVIYERILRLHGLHPTENTLRFDYLSLEDLGCYLASTGPDKIPHSTRLQ